MINPPHHSNEWATKPAGIDTITIWVHPKIINRFDAFHEQGNVHNSVNLRLKHEKIPKTGQIIRSNYIIDIQSEAINPDFNIFDQVTNILTSFVYEGILKIDQRFDWNNIPNFFRAAFSSLFALERIDFFFDVKREDVALRGAPNPQYPNTLYSSDYPSSMKIYDRVVRQKQKNHISYNHINEIEYPMRIEFHLVRGNCNYIHPQNLDGNYEQIFLNYLPFLARKWLTFRSQILDVNKQNLTYDHHLRQVIEIALQPHIPQYTNLLKNPRKPEPFKKAKKEDVDTNWVAYFASRQ
jgi:hypothetical protein